MSRFFSFKPLLKCLLVFFFLLSSSLTAYTPRKGHKPVKRVGDIGQYVIPASAAAMALVRKDIEGISNYASSFSATMGVVYALKFLINAKRPVSGGLSFPSGHTAAAMGGAAFVQIRYGIFYGLPCYLMASYVGFSRVYAQKHWMRDVLGATTLALAANVFFTKPISENYVWVPILERNRAGIKVLWEW